MEDATKRPNIRIEIHNNLVESMDVDEPGEEGEISDSNEPSADPAKDSAKNQGNKQRIWPNANGGFTTGINIFDKEEMGKLQERARRFSLDPSEIKNFTDKQLQTLHDSLGITGETEKDIRFEAVHMRGTDEMSTEDVLEYFGKYGPAAIEWIDDSSCNVLWNDRISAARALYFLSKPIKGMPIEGPCDPFVKELTNHVEDKEEEGRSILLKNKDREIELRDDTDDGMSGEESVLISDIAVPIPPGYWRLGVSSDKSKWILLRFACKSDRKPHKAERFSEYYKKYGNPNYGGLKGLITETHKKKFKGIFDRNKDIKESIDPKNPWGALAMHWNADVKYCEKIEDPPQVVNKGKSDIMSRLGFKRSVDAEQEEGEEPQKKSKVPRMRMYADEEEEKIKRKKQLQKAKLHSKKSSQGAVDDLRNILNTQTHKPVEIQIKEEDKSTEVDLATRLKNRHRHAKVKTAKSGAERERDSEQRERKEYRKRDRSKEKSRRSSYDKYEKKMYSDKVGKSSRSGIRSHNQEHSRDDTYDRHKPRSKIAVVIKTQKAPAVASTVWSRVNSERERLKTVSERKLRYTRSSTSESSDSSSSSSSSGGSDSSSSDSSQESDDEAEVNFGKRRIKSERMEDEELWNKSRPESYPLHLKGGLKLEINNEYFVKK